MNNDKFCDIVFDLLVGGLKSEDELTTVLNFLENVKSVAWCLYWTRKAKKDQEDDKKYLGYLGFDSFE